MKSAWDPFQFNAIRLKKNEKKQEPPPPPVIFTLKLNESFRNYEENSLIELRSVDCERKVKLYLIAVFMLVYQWVIIKPFKYLNCAGHQVV